MLGGPGAGKGTQCANIVRDYGFVHLSAGDLLREHMKSGSKDGNMVADMIKNGQIVPSEVTVNLLDAAMKESGQDKFLIDGFPRNAENRDAFEKEMGYDCDFVLFFDCPEDVMESRLLGRNEGRTDDNIETIRKRFKVFTESSMPVISHYESLGKVKRVIADKPVEEVYEVTKGFFEAYAKADVLSATATLLAAIDAGDWATYASLVAVGITAFEPEAKGQLIEGIDFHKFYFALGEAQPSPYKLSVRSKSHMMNVKVNMLAGGKSAVVTYIRMIQSPSAFATAQVDQKKPRSASKAAQQGGGWWRDAPPPSSTVEPEEHVPTITFPTSATTTNFNETRVWEKQSDGSWMCVHFHKSE